MMSSILKVLHICAVYVRTWKRANDSGKKALSFYVLMYCADFMGECGVQFMDKTVDVNKQKIE